MFNFYRNRARQHWGFKNINNLNKFCWTYYNTNLKFNQKQHCLNIPWQSIFIIINKSINTICSLWNQYGYLKSSSEIDTMYVPFFLFQLIICELLLISVSTRKFPSTTVVSSSTLTSQSTQYAVYETSMVISNRPVKSTQCAYCFFLLQLNIC